MTVKMPSLLKAENRAKLAIHGLKTIKRIQNEVISEADKAIGDVANFEKKYHTVFTSFQNHRGGCTLFLLL
jgi:hypothetical protein